MDAHILIPLVASIGGCAMASAVVARSPGARSSRLAAGLLICGSFWGFLEAVAQLHSSETTALPWSRAAIATTLLFGPLLVELVVEVRDGLREQHRRLVASLWGATGILILLTVATPLVVAGLAKDAWGWRVEYGPAFVLAGLQGGTAIFLAAGLSFRDKSPLFIRNESRLTRMATLCLALLMVTIHLTEVVLALAHVSAPRLGPLSVSLLGGMLWLLSFRSVDHVPSPSSFARQVLDTLDDGVALITSDGSIRSANHALSRLSRRSKEGLVNRNVSKLLGESHRDLEAGLVEHETLLARPDGDSIPISVSTSELFDREGSRLGSVLVCRDQREVVELRRRLVTAGRLAAVGGLAAGIAHEVNNPIAFIQSNLHCLMRNADALGERSKELAGGETSPALREGQHFAGQCLQELSRVASIVMEIRGFSHAGPGDLQWNDVNRLIESAVQIALPRLRNRAKLVLDFGELPPIRCAGQDLKQVFLGLFLSAARGIESNGTIRVTTRPDADRVIVCVEDDGEGLTEIELARVFDPALGYGATREGGIDYSVSYQIATQHGGEMNISSSPDAGTAVELRLPIQPPETKTPLVDSGHLLEASEPGDEPVQASPDLG